MNTNLDISIAGFQATSNQVDQFAQQVLNNTSRTEASGIPEFESAIQETAGEFESVFLSMMLKEMRSTLDQKEGGLFGGEGSDTYGGMFDMFMGQHLAESKPLGIGDAIENYMQNSLL